MTLPYRRRHDLVGRRLSRPVRAAHFHAHNCLDEFHHPLCPLLVEGWMEVAP